MILLSIFGGEETVVEIRDIKGLVVKVWCSYTVLLIRVVPMVNKSYWVNPFQFIGISSFFFIDHSEKSRYTFVKLIVPYQHTFTFQFRYGYQP